MKRTRLRGREKLPPYGATVAPNGRASLRRYNRQRASLFPSQKTESPLSKAESLSAPPLRRRRFSIVPSFQNRRAKTKWRHKMIELKHRKSSDRNRHRNAIVLRRNWPRCTLATSTRRSARPTSSRRSRRWGTSPPCASAGTRSPAGPSVMATSTSSLASSV